MQLLKHSHKLRASQPDLVESPCTVIVCITTGVSHAKLRGKSRCVAIIIIIIAHRCGGGRPTNGRTDERRRGNYSLEGPMAKLPPLLRHFARLFFPRAGEGKSLIILAESGIFTFLWSSEACLGLVGEYITGIILCRPKSLKV